MSIQATAVVKKETKGDPKKPEDKVHYASLCVLNEDAKSTAFYVIWVSSVKLRFCSNVKRELHTNNYTSVLPRTKGAKKSVFL